LLLLDLHDVFALAGVQPSPAHVRLLQCSGGVLPAGLPGEQETCTRAMAAVYNMHVATFGAVPWLLYLLSILDNADSPA
jgi:hypothetical protein